MGIKPETIEKWLTLGMSIAGGIPGAIGGLITFIQSFAPPDVVQEWTPDKVAAYVADWEQKQRTLEAEFDARRTPDQAPDMGGPDNEEDGDDGTN